MDSVELIIKEIGSVFIEAIKASFTFIFEYGGKVFNVFLWIIVGALIIPCVFVTNVFYPMWEKWAENLKN